MIEIDCSAARSPMGELIAAERDLRNALENLRTIAREGTRLEILTATAEVNRAHAARARRAQQLAALNPRRVAA